MIKDMIMKNLVCLLFVFVLFVACQNDNINESVFENEITLNTIFGEEIHIRDIVDKRSASESDMEWQLIDAELNVMWFLYPELKKIVSYMLETSSLKLKLKFDPSLVSDAPAYYHIADHTIYLKSKDFISQDIILHEFIHAARRTLMGESYMTGKSARNVEFEAAVMTDLLLKSELGIKGVNSDAEANAYREWLKKLKANDFSRLNEFNYFAEKLPLYQDKKFDSEFKSDFLLYYWIYKDHEYL